MPDIVVWSTAAPSGQPYGETAATAVIDAKAWPIVLQRAGDGRFYADLGIGARTVTVLVDPAAAASSLDAGLLAEALPAATPAPLLSGLVLEHLRLPPTRIPLALEPGRETVIGKDVLDAYFVVEEGHDRLRLAPRG